jgi:S1-C subfamily serine protease
MKYRSIRITTMVLVAAAACFVRATEAAATDLGFDQGQVERDVTAGKASHTASVDTKDLDAQLAAARARLEEAAHEVAALSAQMSRPFMEKFMMLGEGPPRAVIGVQLDPEGGKDGARIREVSPGGPAADAGLHVGDVITSINGTDVKGDDSARQVLHLMRDVAPESKVRVRALREGKSRDFVVSARAGTVHLGLHDLPPPPPPPDLPGFPLGDIVFASPRMIPGPLGELELVTLTPQLGRYFGTEKGVLVVRAPKDAGFKLEDGDVILAIDGREPTSGSHATRILGSYQPGEKVSLKVMREHKPLSVEAALPERSGMAPESDHKVRIIRKVQPREPLVFNPARFRSGARFS